MRARKREKLERELESLMERRAQLLAELEETSLRGRWLELDDELLEQAEGRSWSRQADAIHAAVSKLEQRIFSLQLELM